MKDQLQPTHNIFVGTDKRYSLVSVINHILIWSVTTLMVGFIYWQVFSDPFLKYYDMPFKVEASEVKPGGLVPIEVKRCNAQAIIRAYTSTRELLNVDTGEITILPASNVSIVPGCSTVLSKLTKLPEDTLPGNYRLQGTAEINDFMSVRLINWYTTSFRVS